MHGEYINRKPFSALDKRPELYFSEAPEPQSVSRGKNPTNTCGFINKDPVQ